MGRTVLIADGSDFVRELVTEVLADDYDVVAQAENGVEAVEMCEQHRPDLVITEIEMPITDGIEATARITDQTPDSNVIVCTSVPEEERMDEALEAGADAYVTKPFQRQGLLDAIEDVAG